MAMNYPEGRVRVGHLEVTSAERDGGCSQDLDALHSIVSIAGSKEAPKTQQDAAGAGLAQVQHQDFLLVASYRDAQARVKHLEVMSAQWDGGYSQDLDALHSIASIAGSKEAPKTQQDAVGAGSA